VIDVGASAAGSWSGETQHKQASRKIGIVSGKFLRGNIRSNIGLYWPHRFLAEDRQDVQTSPGKLWDEECN
jgi:hypothetical protein